VGSGTLPVAEAIGVAARAKDLDIRDYSRVTRKAFSRQTTFVSFAVDGLGSRRYHYLLRLDSIKILQHCFSDLICLAFTELGIHWQ